MMIAEQSGAKPTSATNIDIIDWKLSDPFSLTVLRRKQNQLADLGFKPKHTISTGAYGCRDCNIPRSMITYSLGQIEFNFELCPQCWTCYESFPVYDGFDDSVQLIEQLVPLLTDEQKSLLMSIISIIAMN